MNLFPYWFLIFFSFFLIPNFSSGTNTTIATLPTTTNKASETTTLEPLTNTLDPAITTLDPETTTLAPETTTLVPKTTTLDPEITTLEPETTTLDPEITTLAPETTTLVPETTTLDPDITTLDPETTTLDPETTTLDHEPTTLVPETTSPYIEDPIQYRDCPCSICTYGPGDFNVNLAGKVYELGDTSTPYHENICSLMRKDFYHSDGNSFSYDPFGAFDTFDFETPLLKTEDDYELFKTIVCK